MPSWQGTKAPQAHVKSGTCWCGYVTGRFYAKRKDEQAGMFGGVRNAQA